MKIFLIILALIFAVIFQTTLIPFMAIWGVAPNLILILVLFLVVWKEFGKTWWMIVLTGFFLDLLVGWPLGLISLSLVSTAYLIGQFNQSIFSGIKLWTMISLIILGTLVYNLLLFVLGKVFQIDSIFSLRYLSIEIGYNFLITLIFYVGIKKIFR